MSYPSVSGGLGDAARLSALAATGLNAEADESFDRFASLARATIGAPVSLVSLVDSARQFFPGQVGLGLPWCDSRRTPLSHSFCQYVVTTGSPLVICDARTDPRVAGNLAITELGVLSYAGMPLTDADGHVLGSLCVIDHQPRQWTEAELALLRDLAAACSGELRLRISAARTAALAAERDHLAREARSSLAVTELLLRVSGDLSGATTLTQVAKAVSQMIDSVLGPAYVNVGVGYLSGRQRRIHVPEMAAPDREEAWLHDVDSGGSPMLRCLRDDEPQFYDSAEAVVADYPHLGGDVTAIGRRALACVPLPGADGPIGVLAFWWKHAHVVDATERGVITALAGYTGLAVQRVLLLQERTEVAETLQRAMLTDLPTPATLRLAARYHPAHTGDQVGGDWYDAFHTRTGGTVLVIGDVTGHDITAAAKMGQIRSMLRVLGYDRDEAPDQLLARTDQAMHGLGVGTFASAVVARLDPDGEQTGTHRLQWSNAGHPPPLLQHPDGHVDILTGAPGIILGYSPLRPRTTNAITVPPGSTLLFYTDGLVEQRGTNLHHRIAQLRDLLVDLHGQPLDHLLDALVETLTGDTHSDDIALLACRTLARET